MKSSEGVVKVRSLQGRMLSLCRQDLFKKIEFCLRKGSVLFSI